MTAASAHEILIVDDEPLNIKFLTAVISAITKQTGLNINVTSASNGEEALKISREARPDIVLLDVMMPGMDGYEVCEALKADQETADIKIIFATAMGREQERSRGMEMGAVDYIVKPFDPDKVINILVPWIDRNAVISEATETVPDLTPDMDFPDDMPGIDIKDGLMRVQGNAKLLKQLLIEFRKSRVNAVAELRDALLVGDDDKLASLAHGLKGVAGNIGATELHKASAEMESAVREGRATEFAALCEILVQKISQILDTLNQLAQAAPPDVSSTEDDGDQSVDPQKARPILEDLRGRLEENDMGADELIEPIKALLTGNKYARNVAQLGVSVDSLDFAGALTILDAIAETMNTETQG